MNETTRIYQAINANSKRIEEINGKLDELTRMLHQQNADKIEEITPYTETKTAYILDTEVTFENVPAGNLSVYVKDSDDNYPNYTIERIQDRIIVHFDPLEYVTEVTISIL